MPARAISGLLVLLAGFGGTQAFGGASGDAPGMVLPSPPPVPPGRVAPLPKDPLRAAIERSGQGDLVAAAWYEQQILERNLVTGRTRAAVELAYGIHRLQLGDANAAADAFTRVRASETPVASWGAWYLAKAEQARGHHVAAAQACAGYRSRWPTGPYAEECLVLMGDAYVAAGQRGPAVSAYSAYLTLHPDSVMEEPLKLGMALALSTSDPKAAIPQLQAFAVEHQYHSTGVTAERRLAELAAQGYAAALPETNEIACKRAVEQRRCGYQAQAWSAYQALAARSESDPSLRSWASAQEERFQWDTRKYADLARELAVELAARPSGDTAWDRYKALSRGGDWVEAARQFEEGAKRWPSSGDFNNRELYARVLLLAGRYADARGAWASIGKTGGALGREARFLSAYAAFRAGDAADALTRLGPVVDGGGDEALAGRYYRSRTLDALGRPEDAARERESILKSDPLSWYAALLRSEGLSHAGPSASAPGTGVPVTGTGPGTDTLAADVRAAALVRDGRWAGARPSAPAPLPKVGTAGSGVSRPKVSGSTPLTRGDPGRSGAAARAEGHIDWSVLAWTAPVAGAPVAVAAPTATVAAPPSVGPGAVSGERRPDSYAPGFLNDPAKGDQLLGELGRRYASVFPWASAAADLARAGIYEEAAPIISRMVDAIDAAEDGRPIPASPVLGAGATAATLKAVDLPAEDWRQIYYFVHDDYHAARASWGATRLATTQAERDVAVRRAFPTAEVDPLFRYGHAEDVDPYLMLGLMRQESVYRQWALSSTGAIGLLQIMPRTGSRVAALLGDPLYSPEILQDPATNVRYGVWYLARLLDRFEGAFPLAVGSYNGGPFNMSSWLAPWGRSIRMDDYVEQIPYGETKNYIKKVTGYYATYLSLYAPPGARVEVPPTPRGDHPDVIDF